MGAQNFKRNANQFTRRVMSSRLIIPGLLLATFLAATAVLASQSEAKVQRRNEAKRVGLPDPGSLHLRTGRIIAVRYEEKYGAFQAVDQSTKERGAFIRYIWWYQPDGSGSFINESAQTGYAESRELSPGPSTKLEVGPIELGWSASGDGVGWVYYRHPDRHDIIYELAETDEVDITKVDASKLKFSSGKDQ